MCDDEIHFTVQFSLRQVNTQASEGNYLTAECTNFFSENPEPLCASVLYSVHFVVLNAQ
jgi:hypothetical protein